MHTTLLRLRHVDRFRHAASFAEKSRLRKSAGQLIKVGRLGWIHAALHPPPAPTPLPLPGGTWKKHLWDTMSHPAISALAQFAGTSTLTPPPPVPISKQDILFSSTSSSPFCSSMSSLPTRKSKINLAFLEIVSLNIMKRCVQVDADLHCVMGEQGDVLFYVAGAAT